MDYVLRTENLQKHYRRCKALDGLTMAVPKGSIYGLVGRNGAGKTTLIRVVCALQFPTGGSYELYGRSDTARDAARSRRRVGAVIETPSIYSGLSARENLRQQYNVLGLPSYDGLEELLELVDLRDTGRKPAKDFSWGCGSGWASPWPWRGTRTSSSWTSPPTAWTPRALWRFVS